MHLSNIDRAHINKPKLMMGGSFQQTFNRTNPYGAQGFNQFQPSQTYQSMQNFYPQQNQFNSPQIPQMMMTQPLQYQGGEGNIYQGVDQQQEQQIYQQQIYQTPQNDQNRKTLKLNQQQPALEKVHNIELIDYGGQLPKDKIKSDLDKPIQEEKIFSNQRQPIQPERPQAQYKYPQPSLTQKNDFMKQQNIQEDDSNRFIELYDIEESDPSLKNCFPECVISPQQLALEEQFKQEEDSNNKQDREAVLRAEDAYRKIGRKQYEFNELMFNKDAVERQKKKTQDLIAKGLQREMDKLEKGAEEFENQIKEADEYLLKIQHETNEFDQKLDQLKFVRQAERALKKVERSEKNNKAILEDQDDIRIEKDMNIAEINEKLEETYKKNAELFLEINKLILENKEEDVQLEQDELFYFENYVDQNPEIANSEIKVQKPKQNSKQTTTKKKSKMKK